MPFTFTSTGGSGDGTPGANGKDSFFLGTWNSVTAFLAIYQGGPVGLADGDWWAFVKDNENPNKIYVVREDPNSATGWVIDDNEHFVLPAGADGADGADGAAGADALWNFTGAWVNGIDYGPGSVVEFQGSTYYHPNGQYSSYSPPTNGWLLVSAKGADGSQGEQGNPGEPGEPGADGAAGSSFGIYYLGNYNRGNGYVTDIAVVRGSDGQLYLAKASGELGDPVGNTAQWEVWIPKGADGSNGTNGTSLTSRGAWTDSENYAINDIVTFEGSAYVCIVGVTAGTDVAPYPQHIGAYWNLLVSGSTVDTGQITFMGVYVIGGGAESGDGLGNGTLKLMPDADLNSDQYLIIDPTTPNHIHIRAGGAQDASTANLFLGAERTGIEVSDSSGNVIIRSKNPDLVNTYGNSNSTSNTQFIHATGANILVGDTVRLYTGGDTFTVTSVSESEGAMTVVAEGLTFIPGEAYIFTRAQGEHTWDFTSDGTLLGPVMGGIKSLGLLNSGNNNLELFANDANIVLQAPSGSVDISAPEVNIVSNAVPSSLNINTYLGAIIQSNRTSAYADEDKIVATLGDLPTGATGTFETPDSKLVTVTNGIITSIEPLT